VHGNVCIRTKKGKSMRYSPGIPGDGPVTVAFLRELMDSPGIYLTSKRLARNPRLSAFNSPEGTGPQAMAARLACLRRAFRETAREPWFFQVRRSKYAARWNPDRSYRLIEWLAQTVAKDEQDRR